MAEISNGKTAVALFTFVILSACGQAGGYALSLNTFSAPTGATSSPSPTATPLRVFVTAASFNGNLGGIAGADAKCMADSKRPATGTFKALVGVPGQRVGTVGSQLDWVIHPNRTYTRLDGTVIAVSTATGTFPDPFNKASTRLGTPPSQVF